ncbi:MAG: hypothetical protein ACRC13_09840 [Tannerellaceae bacterium]
MKKSVLLITTCACASILILIISLVWDIPKLQVLSLGTFLSGLGASAGHETRRRYINPNLKQEEIPLLFKVSIFLCAIVGLAFLCASFMYLSLGWKIIAVVLNLGLALYILYYVSKFKAK